MTVEERADEAVRLIKEAAERGSAELSLDGLQLTTIPESLGDLTQLRILYLNGSRLTSLPECLRNLTNLSMLEFKNNDLTSLPEWIGELTALTWLELEYNRLTALPDSLGNLAGLTCLGLHRSISDPCLPLPDSLGSLTRLRVLDLARCGLSALPGWMGGLADLVGLNLYGNNLTGLPSWLGDLTRLSSLSLGENRLAELPDSMGNLTRLKALRLNDNRLAELPDSMHNMVSLEKLWVDDNPLTDLPSGLGRLKRLETVDFTPGPGWVGPPEAVIRGGTANLLEWLRNRGPEPQRRAKLVIVGEGGVGKTSLVKALAGKPYDSEEPRTHGLSVQELTIAHPENADFVMRLSAWDFGGQQIYQGTHQFFLTDHCLVVLVWNARQEWEKGDLGKWLDVIEARAPKAAVLLVATHCAGSAPDMPPAGLLAGYRQITGCFTVDCAARTGIDELRDGLAEQASRLRIMRAAWPPAWLRAREACRDADRDYVSRDELYQLFADAGVGEPGRQWELAEGLTELGEILDGSQEEQPDDVVVLRPAWLSTQISKILDSSEVTARGGLLTRQDMTREWAGIESAVRDHLLDMMDRFDLSYRVDSRDRDALAVVVDCLPKDPPADLGREWEAGRRGEAREIRMRYHLPGLLPPGIPTWFIAREHRFATGLRWRHGVLLRDARGENLGLLTADRQRGVIDLAVRGPQPGQFFWLLDDGLNETFDRYPGLTDRVRREVPCSCRGTEPPGCSQLYDYDDLIRASGDGGTVQCHVSGKLINVTELLTAFPPAVVMSDRALTSDAFERGINRVLAAQDAQTSQILSAIDEGPELIRYLFTKTWQQMRTSCPSVFTLTKKRRLPGVASAYTLRLYCNEPDEWHALRDGGGCFEFTEVDDWLLNLASPLNKLLAVLKCVTPFTVPVLGLAAAGLHSQLKDDMDRMQNLLRELPGPVDLPEGPLDDLPDDVRHAGTKPRSYASTDAEFRRLAAFLGEKIPPRDRWGGLSRHVTPEGDTLYLCPEHLARYMAPARDGQRLQAHTEAGSSRVRGVPSSAHTV